jgi:hypothetical protein
MTKAIERLCPAIGTTDGKPAAERKVPAKFFNPTGAGTWYVLEYDPAERLCFGLAHITDEELGYFGLAELEAVRGRFGLGIERDIHWDPATTLADVQEGRTR